MYGHPDEVVPQPTVVVDLGGVILAQVAAGYHEKSESRKKDCLSSGRSSAANFSETSPSAQIHANGQVEEKEQPMAGAKEHEKDEEL